MFAMQTMISWYPLVFSSICSKRIVLTTSGMAQIMLM